MFKGKLKQFQEKHVKNIIDNIDENYHELLLDAPTGSGKTVMMCKFIDDYLEKYKETVVLWLSPGTGGLETQSQESFDEFVSGIDSGDVYDFIKESDPSFKVFFINWEKIDKKSNVVLRENEKNDLYSKFKYCHNKNIDILFIVDEEHRNQEAAKDLISRADPYKVIRISATPVTTVEFKEHIKDEEVIDAGLISREISVNEGISEAMETGEIPEDNDLFLIEKADEKRKQIIEEYKKLNVDIRPLVLIQFPNGKPEYIERVKHKLELMGYGDSSGLVTEWYTGDHPDNVEEIKKLNGQYAFLLFKQAIATGWDCPRAKVLVKLREGGTEQFNVQTIGRIRRMPERKHYDNEILDNCYLYTFDNKFKTGLTNSVSSSFYEYLYKRKYNFWIPGMGIKKEVMDGYDQTAVNQAKVVEIIRNRMLKEADVDEDGRLSKEELMKKDYIFGTKLLSTSYEQVCKTTRDLAKVSNSFNIAHEINLHDDGFIIREAKRQIARAGNITENVSNNVLRILFGPTANKTLSIFSDDDISFERKNKVVVDLSLKEFDAFIVNNCDKLMKVFQEANANEYIIIKKANIIEKDWNIPENQYYKRHKLVAHNVFLNKNAFADYGDNILMQPKRSYTEIKFEVWCENNPNVEWYYKNGDKGDNYFSIVYEMAFARANFYPDYIVKMMNGDIWIIEAKGGIDEHGDSNNIDSYAKNKFDALKEYAKRHENIKWGFARAVGQFIYFSNTNWDENVYNNAVWKNINDIVK